MKHEHGWVKFDKKHNVSADLLDGLKAGMKHDMNTHDIILTFHFKEPTDAYSLFRALNEIKD
jgi:hypothetical protein